jgi:DNA-binding MarR family transcriptional regulator
MNEVLEQLYDAVDALKIQDGLSPSGLLELPSELANIIRQLVRNNGMSLSEIATTLNYTPEGIRKILDALVEKGYIRRIKIQQEFWYKARFKRKADRISTPERGQVNSLLDDLIHEE